MTYGKALLAAGVLVLASFSTSAISAQAASPAAKLAFVPYEEPGGTDPFAQGVSRDLTDDFAAAGVAIVPLPPVNHLEAVATAAKICADTGTTGLLIPEGRYEQTGKHNPFINIITYPTHVELRLDEVGCDGTVRWTTTATGDQSVSGFISVGNLGATVDAAYRIAAQGAVKAFAGATVVSAPPAAPRQPGAPIPPGAKYLVLPFAQPTIADPHVNDVTHSFILQLQKRNLNVVLGAPIDHLTAIATAPQLCAAAGAQGIIVPNVRIEQSDKTGRSHASMHLGLLDCGGALVATGADDADMGGIGGSAVTGIAERAMVPSLDQLFPSTKAS
ncbi:MAG TPA: hypothetical protein VMD91_06480 [Candidatus Sulfotelmatobacter sp.]|nr:hypothetical protein [Candidatus Sulfotelmatobacter sp.]